MSGAVREGIFHGGSLPVFASSEESRFRKVRMDKFIDIVGGFRIQDFFDILIISTLIYVVLIWFKDTASRFVFAGISLLGVVYLFARLFHLYLTSLVLQGFFTILLIALVVIFQEDIRRFFERLATWGALRKARKVEGERRWPVDVDVLIESTADLAARKIGAIIVLQGRDPLERHLKGGYDLNGKLSQPLLASIFDPHSIGHDGAAIIDDNKVIKFGCHLPLSLDTSKFGKFGLRHTAAIGLSERSDVLCIVVSEERGTISVVQDGRITVAWKPSDLSSIITDYYEKEQHLGDGRLRSNWWRKNTVEKAIAVMLAFGLWFAFGYQKESVQRDFVVPIEYRNISPEWEIEENRHREVTVTLTGPDQAFDLLDPSVLKISVSLSNLIEGRQDIPLSGDMVRVPSNLSLVRINPDTIRLNAYRFYLFNAPIHVNTSNELPKGYDFRGIATNPTNVPVYATRNFIRRKAPLETEKIDLSQVHDTGSYDTRIIIPPEVRLKSNQSQWVRVTVYITRKRG
jgi:diadenylate cyclase